MQYSRYARATASNKVGMPGLPSGDPGVDHKSTARGQGRKQPGLQRHAGQGHAAARAASTRGPGPRKTARAVGTQGARASQNSQGCSLRGHSAKPARAALDSQGCQRPRSNNNTARAAIVSQGCRMTNVKH